MPAALLTSQCLPSMQLSCICTLTVSLVYATTNFQMKLMLFAFFHKLKKIALFAVMDFKGFHGFWTLTLFILATIAIQCRSEVYSLAQHLSAVCSSRRVMHHRCKKVNVKTCCHEEKCSLSLMLGFSHEMKAVTGGH